MKYDNHYTQLNQDKVFFLSDTHFSHQKVLDSEDRNFKNVEEMDNFIIKRWNEQVDNENTVFFLGDFCFGNEKRWREILKQLNGKIIFM